MVSATPALTWDPREGSHRANSGRPEAARCAGQLTSPRPRSRPVSRSPFELKLANRRWEEDRGVANSMICGDRRTPEAIPGSALSGSLGQARSHRASSFARLAAARSMACSRSSRFTGKCSHRIRSPVTTRIDRQTRRSTGLSNPPNRCTNPVLSPALRQTVGERPSIPTRRPLALRVQSACTARSPTGPTRQSFQHTLETFQQVTAVRISACQVPQKSGNPSTQDGVPRQAGCQGCG